MDTNALKNFATWARTTLLREVEARTTVVLAAGAVERVEHLGRVRRLEADILAAGGGQVGRRAVVDKVAYTWFNRVIALRFMDANGYTGVGVVSPAQGQPGGQPEILVDAKNGVFDSDVVRQTVIDEVNALLDEQRTSNDPQGEAYACLLAEYCHHWHQTMPFMFESDDVQDYTELLLPAALLAEDSIVSRAATALTAEVCEDVEVLGWLYQFYIAERKDEVFAGFKKNKKAGAEEIPAATQLFTPHWIVRYLVDNSVGRLWMLNHPGSSLVDQMDYYIAPTEEQIDFLEIASPEELTVIDPACGSGHMLTYAFDLLYAIYEEEGYASSEIPAAILTNNLYGTEIDPRAAALAAFALTMKARARHRRFFNKQVRPNICVLNPVSFTPAELDVLVTKDGDRYQEAKFWNQFQHADTLGSLIQPDTAIIDRLHQHAEGTLKGGDDLFVDDLHLKASQVLKQARYLKGGHSVVVANPPYMGSKNMDGVLASYLDDFYNSFKADLFAAFINRCTGMTVAGGACAMVTMHSWMFLQRFSEIRDEIIRDNSLCVLAHLGSAAFDSIPGEVVSTAAFILSKGHSGNSDFIRLVEFPSESSKDAALRGAASSAASQWVYSSSVGRFLEVPNHAFSYWLSDGMIKAFSLGNPLGSIGAPRQGMATSDNARFTRQWYEVSCDRIGFGVDRDEVVGSSFRWFPYNKGGGPRKWYGNQDVVVNWEDGGREVLEFAAAKYGSPTRTIKNIKHYFRPSVSWSKVGTGLPTFRYYPQGFIFDVAGTSIFGDHEDLISLAAICNSNMARVMLTSISPTMNLEVGTLTQLPVLKVPEGVAGIVESLIEVHKNDWDHSELSWNFKGLSILESGEGRITEAIALEFNSGERRAREVRGVEVELNEKISQLYSLGSEVSPDVPLHEVTLKSNPEFRYGKGLGRSSLKEKFTRDAVADLVSYSVGCMFGRYSIDSPGLILADQGATLDDYRSKVPQSSFLPDEDNVIPVLGDDRFEDDIVARFRTFLRAAFGEEHFGENVRFVTESLGVKSIREYFVKKFYAHHVQRYKKRPIYWMFSSPKGAFHALVYLHRYTPSTASTVLGYLREYRNKLASALENAERTVQSATGREAAAARKEAVKLRKDLVELEAYEHEVLYPLATQRIELDLNDGVRANYLRLSSALKKITGLEAKE
ncbi:BREX-1 system adenine-specific DNA-methyltransferase PglX [Streptomyces xinghaiensis]|uniref:BREX-1 system adenine-specific DNA-methyltransferase PglX n=1 Tax=Streptomyces xinghaiensis TaxID=1038928 RepID=UPI003793C8E6